MRKTFLTFCTVALALFAVSSCGKFEDGLADLQDQINDLETRVSALETKLNDQVATINATIGSLESAYKAADADLLKKLEDGDKKLAAEITALTAEIDAIDGMVDGKINAAKDDILKKITELTNALDSKYTELKGADSEILAALVSVGVTKVEKNAAGNAVLTFTDGSTVEVGKYDANANNAGVVTVVEEDGVKYWAVVGADGKAQSLGVEVGHPDVDLKFDVDAESGELSYSVDGGATWTPTGAVVPKGCECLLTDFYQGETGDYVYDEYWNEIPVLEDFYTVVFGGETYYLPIYKVDNSVVMIKAGKTYFTYGESKLIEVAISDITACYVMTKPDGWRAKLDGRKLTVTAPAEANVTSGNAEADGEVLLHCTTVEGKCKIAKLAVATTAGFSLTVDAEGNVTIINPIVMTTVNWEGIEITDFGDAYVGLADIAAFEADPVSYVETIQDNWDALCYGLNNWKMNTAETDEDWNMIYTIGGTYEPGVYEVDVIKTTVPQMYSDWTWGEEMPRGSQFVVWACPQDDQGMPVTDELVFGYYTPIDIAAELVGEPSFNEITVNVALYGAKEYIVGKIDKEYTFNWNTDSYDLEYYITSGLQGLAYGYNNLGMTVVESGEFEYKLSEVVNDMEEVMALSPNREYWFYVIPVIDGKEWSEYTFDDVFAYEYKTAALVAGGAGTVEFTNEEISYTSFVVDLAASEGTSTIYYNFFDPSMYDELENVAETLIAEGYVANGTTATARENNGIKPGDSRVLAAIAVDETGKYGEVAYEVYTAPELVYSETFKASVNVDAITSEEIPSSWGGNPNYSMTIPVTVEGGTAAKYYYYWGTSVRSEESLMELPLGNSAYYGYITVDEIPALTFSGYSTSYQFAVVVESTEGELSKPVIVTVNKPE